jgi:hypothetical protein
MEIMIATISGRTTDESTKLEARTNVPLPCFQYFTVPSDIRAKYVSYPSDGLGEQQSATMHSFTSPDKALGVSMNELTDF